MDKEWICECNYHNVGPICTKCGRLSPENKTPATLPIFAIGLRREELASAFSEADNWIKDKRLARPLGSFGMGEQWGEVVLKEFLPEWFRIWFEKKHWARSSLCRGISGFWIFAETMGVSKDQFWHEVAGQEILYAVLEYRVDGEGFISDSQTVAKSLLQNPMTSDVRPETNDLVVAARNLVEYCRWNTRIDFGCYPAFPIIQKVRDALSKFPE